MKEIGPITVVSELAFIAIILLLFAVLSFAGNGERNPNEEAIEKLKKKEEQLKQKEEKLKEIEEQLRSLR